MAMPKGGNFHTAFLHDEVRSSCACKRYTWPLIAVGAANVRPVLERATLIVTAGSVNAMSCGRNGPFADTPWAPGPVVVVASGGDVVRDVPVVGVVEDDVEVGRTDVVDRATVVTVLELLEVVLAVDDVVDELLVDVLVDVLDEELVELLGVLVDVAETVPLRDARLSVTA